MTRACVQREESLERQLTATQDDLLEAQQRHDELNAKRQDDVSKWQQLEEDNAKVSLCAMYM